MRSTLTLLLMVAAAIMLAAVPPAWADKTFDNDNNNGLWVEAANWADLAATPGPDAVPNLESAEMFLEDLNNPLPLYHGIPTITLDSGTHQLVSFVMGGGSDTDVGDIQLRMTDGTLQVGGDSRIGRGSDTETAFLSNQMNFLQEGGTVEFLGGTGTDLKLSADKQYSGKASYIISGGSFSSTGTITYPQSGDDSDAMFKVVGTGPTSISLEDIKMEASAPGTDTLAFVLDAGGVTPIQLADEFQMENINLDLSLSDVPPSGNIVLVKADRLSNDNQFVGLPDGSTVSAAFGSTLYSWTINYYDTSDDGLVVDAIILSNMTTSPVPEPASLLLLGMGAAMLVAVRRRRG